MGARHGRERMTGNLWILAGALGLLMNPGPPAKAEIRPRAIPQPLAAHPGNIFLAAEQVIVEAPPNPAQAWRVLD